MPLYRREEMFPDEYKKYLKLRTSDEYVEFEYFDNDVLFNKRSNSFDIYVYPFHENNSLFADDFLSFESLPIIKEGETVQSEIFTKLSGLFNIDFAEQEQAFGKNTPRLLNKFSGTKISVPLGEGIINFCYADFEKNIDTLIRAFDEETPGHCTGDEQNKKINAYCRTMTSSADFFYTSLYTAIFPPVFNRFNEQAKQKYIGHLKALQTEFLDMVEFCFDKNFYSEALGSLYPSERYHLYCHLHGRSAISKRVEIFTADQRRYTGDSMPYGMPPEEMAARYKMTLEDNKQLQTFADKYANGNIDAVKALLFPQFINVQYSCRSVYEMLNLEFTKMLEYNIAFKKCGRCGRYFIMKGNYNTEFCDRVQDGETQTCQTFAAQEHYKTKVSTNAAWNAYNKYYKRYFARTKAGTIKPPIFKKWIYEAVRKRDNCFDGKLSLDDFVAWMEDSFPNRKKREPK